MNPFIEAYAKISDPNTNEITIKDLRKYAQENHLDEGFVRKWQDLFDRKGTGVITLRAFCDTLGLKESDVLQARQRSFRQGRLKSDVIVISHNMNIDDQIIISDEFRRIMQQERTVNIDEYARKLKLFLEQKYGPAWHVVVCGRDYATRCKHIPDRSFHFRMNSIGVSTWQTPDS